eukprot:3611219-Rhodomonas_salina.1
MRARARPCAALPAPLPLLRQPIQARCPNARKLTTKSSTTTLHISCGEHSLVCLVRQWREGRGEGACVREEEGLQAAVPRLPRVARVQARRVTC